MSPSYDRYDRGCSRRGVWKNWVPLAVTVTVAAAAAAAWAWRQSRDDDGDHVETGMDYDNADYGDNPPYGGTIRQAPESKPPARDDQSHREAPAPSDVSGASWGARVSGALRRTPSPQQLIDSTGKTVAAGVVAAGAAVGKALASIREEDRAYSENPWSEEADAKKDRAPPSWNKKSLVVAVVVSADIRVPQNGEDASHELAVGHFVGASLPLH